MTAFKRGFFMIVMIIFLNLFTTTIPAQSANLTFQEYLITGSPIYPSGAAVGDFDKDSDLDIAITFTTYDRLSWWENNGAQAFTEHIISSSIDGANDVVAVDMDQDNDLDLITIAAFGNQLDWWENDTGTFTRHIVSTSVTEPRKVIAHDLDNDNDIDLITASPNDAGGVHWWENDGSQNFTVHTLYDYNTDDIRAVDLDKDNDLDLVGVSLKNVDGIVHWWENNGAANFSHHIIYGAPPSTVTGEVSVFPIDLDRDNDIDLLSANYHSYQLLWWENDGAQNFTRRVLLSSFHGARVIAAADLDHDRDYDILAGADNTEELGSSIWMENDGNQQFNIHTLDDHANNEIVEELLPVDLDQDSYIDVLQIANIAHQVSWWKNLGPDTDTIPPAAVTDFSAQPGSFPGDVVLSWTAPGDDSTYGTAHHYEIRWGVQPITTEELWTNSALPADGEPTPLQTGTVQTATIHNSPGYTLYYALKSCDEVGNCSALSNSPSVLTPGMLISDINEQLEENPEAILGQEVTIAAVPIRTDDWSFGVEDYIQEHETLVRVLSTLKEFWGKGELGWTLGSKGGWAALGVYVGGLMADKTVETWRQMRAQLVLGTDVYEYGDATLLLWDVDAPLPADGFPHVLTGVVSKKVFTLGLDDYFYYLKIESSESITQVTPSSSETHFTIPDTHTFMDAGTIADTPPVDADVCGIGIVHERYTKDSFAYLMLMQNQRIYSSNNRPLIVRVSASTTQPKIGALVMVCGTKQFGLGVYDGWIPAAMFLNTLESGGEVTVLRGGGSMIDQHEYLNPPGLFLHLGSPVDLHIYDATGNHVGAVYQSGTFTVTGFENEIPDALYFYGAGVYPEFLYLPNPSNAPYTVEIVGTETGVYTYTQTILDSVGTHTFTETLTSQPISPGDIITQTIDQMPIAPTGLKATVAGNNVILDWNDNLEPDLAGYYVFRSHDPTGIFERLNTTPLTQSTFIDTSGSFDGYYYVSAINITHIESGHLPPVTVRYELFIPAVLR